jgi:hypothetical protein
MKPASAKFVGYHLKWPIKRTSRGFRVYVVEPGIYDPPNHAAIFNATVTALSSPAQQLLDPFTPAHVPVTYDKFDLVTFPEAFLPAEDLTQSLVQISKLPDFGCVHVGLRPGATDDTHLFSVSDVQALLAGLSGIAPHLTTDLKHIAKWLAKQAANCRFNIGCLFAIDAKGRLRVCIHPKMVKSKYEVSPLPEHNMTEANLLTLITLQPQDKAFLSVTLQPLLCSDALQLDTDHPGRLPIEGVNTGAACLGGSPPDQVDIVSVATCTPQPQTPVLGGSPYRQWHQHFRSTFQHAGDTGAWPRHYHCTFVLANFHTVPNSDVGVPGGLSGVFVPVPTASDVYPPFVLVSSFGKDVKGADNTWSIPSSKLAKRDVLGHIAQINPQEGDSLAATMMGFTITRFPRDVPRWKSQSGLTDFRLFKSEAATGVLKAVDQVDGGGNVE